MAAEKLGFISQGITKAKIASFSNQKETKKNINSLSQLRESNVAMTAEYYDFTVQKIKIAGYGNQIGGFMEAYNIVEFVEDLQKKYNDRIFIQVSVIQNVNHYKVNVEQLNTNDKT